MLSTSRAEAYRLLIADVYELAGTSRRTSLAAAASAGLSVAGWHLLSVLQDGALTVPQAAARLGQSRQAVQRVADVLGRAGHVRRVDDEGRARSPRLVVSESGERALRAAVAAADEQRGRELTDVSAEELLTAREVLRRVLGSISPGRRPGPAVP